MEHFYQKVSKGTLVFETSAIFSTDQSLDLTICELNRAWKNIVTRADLENQALRYNSIFSEYYNDLKRYLKSACPEAKFSFEGGKFVIKIVLENKMEILFFQTPVIEVDFSETIHSLLDAFYNSGKEASEELQLLTQKHATLQEGCKTLERKMDEFIKRKQLDEESLYNNFIAVLNEKKLEIQHLKDLLIAFRQGRPTVNHLTSQKGKARGKTMPKKIVKAKASVVEPNESDGEDSSSGSEKHYSTDDGENHLNKRDLILDLSPKPTTSKIEDDEMFVETPDSPQSSLPKKIFIEDSECPGISGIVNVIDAPGSKLEPGLECETVSKEVDNDRKHKKALKVDFNTQDLLDEL